MSVCAPRTGRHGPAWSFQLEAYRLRRRQQKAGQVMGKRKEQQLRELEAARNAKILELHLSEVEGRVCLCEHPQAFHWKNPQGECLGNCGVLDCGCNAYDENVFAAIELRHKKQTAPTDEDALARAMRAEELSAPSGEGDWDWAVRATEKPRKKRQRRLSPRRDRATLDALRALGGDPEDL